MPSWLLLYYDEPLELVRGEGTRVWDAGGSEYLDFFGGIVTTISGHVVPKLVEALTDQANKIAHTSTVYLIRPMVELAERLTGLAPVDPPVKAFFVGSGTEAVEAALLFATTERRSNEVIALRNSYHGRSFGAVGITGNKGWSATSFSPLNVSYALSPYCYRCPLGLTYPDCGVACAEDLRNVMRYLDERMRDLNRLLRELIQQEQRKKGVEPRDHSQRSALADKNFAFYTEEDIRRMNDAVTRLAQRLKNRLSVRRKRAPRGRFNVKDTLRKNLQHGGVPFHIQLDRRKKTKPQVMVLCDISDSVLNASRFMLQFVYSIQDLYSKVRSFVFVADIGEVTRLFEEHDIQTAVETALKGDVIDADDVPVRLHSECLTGDAIGSLLGFGLAARALGKEVVLGAYLLAYQEAAGG